MDWKACSGEANFHVFVFQHIASTIAVPASHSSTL